MMGDMMKTVDDEERIRLHSYLLTHDVYFILIVKSYYHYYDTTNPRPT
jgi:hypothetical protein